MSQDSWFLFGSHSISCCSSVSSFCSCWFPLVAGRTIQFLFSEFPLDAELRQRPTTQDRLERGQRAGFDDVFCLGNSVFFLVSCGIDVWNLSSLSHLRYPNFQANPYCITMFVLTCLHWSSWNSRRSWNCVLGQKHIWSPDSPVLPRKMYLRMEKL